MFSTNKLKRELKIYLCFFIILTNNWNFYRASRVLGIRRSTRIMKYVSNTSLQLTLYDIWAWIFNYKSSFLEPCESDGRFFFIIFLFIFYFHPATKLKNFLNEYFLISSMHLFSEFLFDIFSIDFCFIE